MNTWRNCIITNGEHPISNANSGGGASMTREEAIKWLEETKLGGKIMHDDTVIQVCDMAISAIKNQPVWISVTEMLPEPNETVLVYRKFWNFGMDRYDGESFIHKDVTHWIPMPRLPEKV